MKVRTTGMTTMEIYALIESHIEASGPCTYRDIASANPDVNCLDIRDALKILNGRTIYRLGRGHVAVYDVKRDPEEEVSR